VSVAECRSIARFNGWGDTRRAALDALLAAFTIVGIDSDAPIVTSYVEMYSYLRSVGKNFEKNQNDLWVAALAHVMGALLLTTDFKLRPLDPKFVSVEAYDPVTGALQSGQSAKEGD
jgi:predicted nucleic acid-binding protein